MGVIRLPAIFNEQVSFMAISNILLIILILLLIGVLPAWPHSRGWGYYPSSGLGGLLVLLIILRLLGII